MFKFLNWNFFFSALTLSLFFSCSGDGSKKAKIVLPGKERVAQVYFLFDQRNPSPWVDNISDFEDEALFRFVKNGVTNANQVDSILREWSGRPIDLLMVGPGLPQSSYIKLALPISEGRKTLFLLSDSLDPSVFSATIVMGDVEKLKQKLCGPKAAWACGFANEEFSATKKGEQRDFLNVALGQQSDDFSRKAHLHVRIDWLELIRFYLADASLKKNQPMSLSNGLLTINRSDVPFKDNALLKKSLLDFRLSLLKGS